MMKRLVFLLGLLLAAPAQAQQIFTGSAGLSVASGAFTCTSAGVCTLNPVSAIATSLAIGGCTIGANVVCVTGPANISGLTTFGQSTWTGASPQINLGPPNTNDQTAVRFSSNSIERWDIGVDNAGNGTKDFFIYDKNANLIRFDITTAGAIQIGSGQLFGFTSTTNAAGTLDTALSRNAAGIVQFGTTAANASGSAIAASFQTGGSALLTLTAGALGMSKMTASASAPGAAGSKFEVVCGTNAGTAKMVMYAGISGTAVTVIDNAGTGVTGC